MISLNLLEKIKKWNDVEQFFDNNQIDVFMNVFKNYSENKFVYPTVFKRNGLSIEKVYMILHYLKSKGILKVYFEVFCHECKNSNGEIYNTIAEIPTDLECQNCGNKLCSLNNFIMIYKVVKEDI